MELGISLGSNLGNRVAHLRDARKAINAVDGVSEIGHSPIYETDPVDVSPQYQDMMFLNAVLIIQTDKTASDWLNRLNTIETHLGRVRDADKNAPRTIDLDILYAGDQCIDSGGLIVPHPRWTTRRFVLQPLADVRGALVLPGQTDSVSTLLANLQSDENLNRLDDEW